MGTQFVSIAEAWAAVKSDYDRRPLTAEACKLGDHFVSGGAITKGQPTLYILGFNGGEPTGGSHRGHTRAATKWFAQCGLAQQAVGSEGYLIVERCHWGSPSVGDLRSRIGDDKALRAMLTLHAAANRALFLDYPPLIVWAPGVSTYIREAIEDYGLTEKDALVVQKSGRCETVWRLFKGSGEVPFLFTKHPAARPSVADWTAIRGKLAELAAGRRSR